MTKKDTQFFKQLIIYKMKLKSLKKFEKVNKETLVLINGGLAEDSRKQDSTQQDSKRNDTIVINGGVSGVAGVE